MDSGGAERLTRPGAQQRPGHLGGWFQHDGRVSAWLEAFLPAWLGGRLGETARAAAGQKRERENAPQRPATRAAPARPAAPSGRVSLPELV